MTTDLQARGDVAVIGGGIIGLSVAFELSTRGAAVRVFDKEQPARAASWAAAGMLAPLTERIADAALQRLCEDSLAQYPAFVERVRGASGLDPHLQLNGILHVAYDAQSLDALRVRHSELHALGIEAAALDREQTLVAEPALARSVVGALLVPGEGQIDNRRLGRALIAACEAQGVRIETGVESLRIECDTRRALGIRSERGYFAAGAIVNAAGAWAAQIPGAPESCIPPVRPVKGEMIAIEVPVGFVRRTTWVPGAYMVPRRDGRLLVGATSAEAGFDTRVTAGGVQSLLTAAVTAAPSLRAFTVSEAWAGLRPGTPDERPFLGPTSLTSYYLAAGHYRNGILLAPITARILADALEGAQPPSEFSVERRRGAA